MHPVLIKLGPVTIYTYGLFIFLAFLLPYLLARKEASQWGISEEFLSNLWLVILFGGVIGGKILFILLHLPTVLSHIHEINYWRGGFAYFGGFFFAYFLGAWYIRKKGYSLPQLSYFLTPYIPLGQALGRIGCFFNGCCYGKPTSLPWGMVFQLNSPAGHHYGLSPLHPTQLYASLFHFCFFLFLKNMRDKRKHKWRLLPFYLLIYLCFRGFLDFLRGDAIKIIGELTILQAFIPFLLSITFIWWIRWKE